MKTLAAPGGCRDTAFCVPSASPSSFKLCPQVKIIKESDQNWARPKRFELLTPRFLVWCRCDPTQAAASVS